MRYILHLVEECPEITKYVNVPTRENTNAGVDLITVENWVGSNGDHHLLNLGVKAMLVCAVTQQPVHYWLAPRSSIYKTGYMMANSLGIIDSSYRGTLKAPVVAGPALAAGPSLAGALHENWLEWEETTLRPAVAAALD